MTIPPFVSFPLAVMLFCVLELYLLILQRPAPLLSMEAYEDEEAPLGQLAEAAGRDEATVWHRVRFSS